MVFRRRRIDAHAADGILDQARRSGLFALAVLAATAGMNRRRRILVMAGMSRALAVCVIVSQ